MDLLTTGAVLVSAVMYAIWNALIKNSEDQLVSMGILTATGGALALVALPWLPSLPAESWVYMGGSVVLHLAYQLCLIQAYRFGDLSQVYPVFRGIPPVLVALLSGFIAGEYLAPVQMMGVVVISGGIASLAFYRGWPQGQDKRALGFALAAALAISAFSFADGLGVRLSGNVLTYSAWLFLLSGIPQCVIAWERRRGRLWPIVRRTWRGGVTAGLLAGGGFSIILWAFTHAELAPVSALRETSVIFAAVIGTWMLGEPFGRLRIVAAVLVVAGIVMLHTGV